jgi:DNA-binding winged helix-turn-helix (wHTH) protein
MSTQSSAIREQEQSQAAAPIAFPGRYARFGAFEADFHREELYQNGSRVKVQAKLFQALLLLLGRAGEVVTREEVRRHLWPDAFLTNLDANVNTTMNKLRQVLGDSPETAAYIETIPRRGYTFIAQIEFSDAQGKVDERAKTAMGEPVAKEAGGRLWSEKRLHMFARMVTLLLAGMILGALLAFAWIFSRGKSQRVANDMGARVVPSTCEFARISG